MINDTYKYKQVWLNIYDIYIYMIIYIYICKIYLYFVYILNYIYKKYMECNF